MSDEPLTMKATQVEDIYELSPLQQGMFFHCLYAPQSGVYFEQVCFRRGNFNVPAFVRAWQKVIDRHAILRTSFHWEDLEKPVQVVYREVQLPFVRLDWRGSDPAQQQQQLEHLLGTDREDGFDLSRPPLMRLICIELESGNLQFIWSFHHLLLDGWSVQLLLKEVAAFYGGFSQGRSLELERSRPYGDYIGWLQEQDLREAEIFWRRTFDGFTAPAQLFTTAVRKPDPRENQYDELEVSFPAHLMTALNEVARSNQLTVNTLIQAAWGFLLSHYTGETDVVFGTVVSGRPASLKGVDSIVGLFINTLPVRFRSRPAASLLEIMRELQAQCFEARQYEYSPLLQVQNWSGIPNGVNLFETILVYENYPVDQPLRDQGGAQNEIRHLERTNYPLTILIVPGTQLRLKFLYDCQFFDSATIARIAEHFRIALEGVSANGFQTVSQLSFLSERERVQLVNEWGQNPASYETTNIVSLFERQVKQTPKKTAFIHDEEKLSYAELNRRANQLAFHLKSMGVGREVIVGACFERSFNLAVALLAILKAGAAYLPLDAKQPRQRLAHIINDAKPSLILTDKTSRTALRDYDVTTVCVDTAQAAIAHLCDADPVCVTEEGDLAYVIYTSGSTGTPKGVAVEHRQILNRFDWLWKSYPFQPDELSCQRTAPTFVDSIWELLGPLLQGVTTLIVPEQVSKDMDHLVKVLGENNVTRIWVVPSLLQALLRTFPDLQRHLPKLEFWVASGEALSTDLFQLFQRLMPQSVLYNLYGTSEVWDVTWFDPEREQPRNDCAPIGRPIQNMETYVINDYLQPVATGVPAELYIGGVGLARGYLNSPDLTAERFVPHPFSTTPGARLYRTGDIVRYLDDGNLQYIGRRDQQVKIRGFRIELSEIELALRKHDGVSIAAVAKSRDGKDQLTAYVVPKVHTEPDKQRLREHLRRLLPEYMVPSEFVFVRELPLNSHGKINRLALFDLVDLKPESSPVSQAPRTPVEESITNMFAEVLQRKGVGIYDDFFADLGGHSLLATQVVSRVRKAFQVELPISSVFDLRTAAALAEHITRIQSDGNGAKQHEEQPSLEPLPREQYRISHDSEANLDEVSTARGSGGVDA